MSFPLVIERTFASGRRGRSAGADQFTNGPKAPGTEPAPRVPRIARLMALAWHIETLVRGGTVSSYAEVARVGHVSRARVCQIVSLRQLAPDLQEELLFLARPAHGREPMPFRQVLSIAAVLDWHEQRRRWRKLRRATKAGQ